MDNDLSDYPETYVEQMRFEANKRRAMAEAADDDGLREWLLSRAEYFDRCADETDRTD